MKKLFFFVILLVLINTKNGFAQWVASPGLLTTTSNVGIGTANPKTLLDLGPAGGVKFLNYGTGGTNGYQAGMGVNLGQATNSYSLFIGGANGTSSGASNFEVVSANQATYPYTSYTTRLAVNSRTGNVGIGVAAPSANLEVASGWSNALRVGVNSNRANMSTQLASSLAVIGNDNMATTVNGAVAWDFYNNGNNASWSGVLLEHIGTGVTGTQYGLPASKQGQLVFQNVDNSVIGTNGSNLFISPGAQLSTTFFTNGNVGIGTSLATSYKLAVNGSAIFTRAVVKLYANWPDYVFAPVYQLPHLKEVEAYIIKHQHLEGMPTSAEVENDGIDLGSNQALLLKKVEELTLYVIELNKKVEAISKENELLKKGANSYNP